jgi:hypothetical protein
VSEIHSWATDCISATKKLQCTQFVIYFDFEHLHCRLYGNCVHTHTLPVPAQCLLDVYLFSSSCNNIYWRKKHVECTEETPAPQRKKKKTGWLTSQYYCKLSKEYWKRLASRWHIQGYHKTDVTSYRLQYCSGTVPGGNCAQSDLRRVTDTSACTS